MLLRVVELFGDVAYVPLTKGKRAVIDSDMAEAVGRYNWYAENPHGGLWYASRSAVAASGKKSMHREIIGAQPGEIVDHKDGDGLNNRRSNLRIATHQENMRNRGSGGRGALPKGVQSYGGGYIAVIGLDGRAYQVGRLYKTPEEASEVYELFASKVFGEFYRKRIR